MQNIFSQQHERNEWKRMKKKKERKIRIKSKKFIANYIDILTAATTRSTTFLFHSFFFFQNQNKH